MRAEATLTRRLAADLDRIGVSATGFAMLVLLTSAGGELELRAIRRRLGASKATATEVLDTLENRGFVDAQPPGVRPPRGRGRADPGGRQPRHPRLPGHAERVREAFGGLDEDEKRQLAEICRKLDRAA